MPSVPAEQIVPAASRMEYFCFSMTGKAISPSMTTEAPMIPVLAAITTPTIVTDRASPPGRCANRRSSASSRFLAILDFSSISPMKTNNGTAIISQFVRVPVNIRDEIVLRKISGTSPMNVKSIPTPASTSATGYPVKMPPTSISTIAIGKMYSVMLSVSARKQFAKMHQNSPDPRQTQKDKSDRQDGLDQIPVGQPAVIRLLAGVISKLDKA